MPIPGLGLTYEFVIEYNTYPFGNFLSIGNDDFFEFTDLTSQAKLPLTVFHVSELGGANQDSIFILEGAHWNAEETNYVYRFDTKINQLSIPVVKGKAPSMRKGISSVSSEGKIKKNIQEKLGLTGESIKQMVFFNQST
ncbi:hypothetical protein RhiirA5_431469 [Rhizophagus irregularis]|uniref:Uncharacterized protein n=1 Tax=Rhizophagus irregularis TaxID=588596 RepID=A0A2N0NUW6_9GLOM|nr:hypothetical protein RhiirA5_431469 [Rhizophagus irregularis]